MLKLDFKSSKDVVDGVSVPPKQKIQQSVGQD